MGIIDVFHSVLRKPERNLFNVSSGEKIAALHEQAVRVAETGDWEHSTLLLERCCKLARFELPQLNSQWMVSAARMGAGLDLGSRALHLAQSAWLIHSHSGALEFLQLALWRPPLNVDRATEAIRLSREWPTCLASLCQPPDLTRKPNAGNQTLRIGHVLGCLNPTHAPTKLVQILASEISSDDALTYIYSSEWSAGWFQNWSQERQSGPPEFLESLSSAGLYVQDAQGNFLDRANRLVRHISETGIDVLVVHASNVELTTALVASMRPAARVVNVNHASAMSLPCFDGFIHLFGNGIRRSATSSARVEIINPASDMADRLRSAPDISRQTLGIPAGATVSGTFGNLYKIDNSLYLSSLRGILESHPMHHHLIAGAGDEGNIREHFHESGIIRRIHLLGRRTDIPSLLKQLDFYLASHPYPGALSEIEAMAAACPVISMRSDADSHYNSGAEVIGIEECLVDKDDSAGVVAHAKKFLGDRSFARKVGEQLQQRYLKEFHPVSVAGRHLDFYRSLLQPSTAG